MSGARRESWGGSERRMDSGGRGERPLRSCDAGSPREAFERERRNVRRTAGPDLRVLKGNDLVQALKERFPKKVWDPSVLLLPNPVVLVSCGSEKLKLAPDIVTVAWAGIVNTSPAMVSISLRPERHSYGIIKQTGEFVVNVPPASLAKVVDWCGMKSGREVDKFSEMRLTALPATTVGCPIVADCPVNLECKVSRTIPLGTHDLILAKVTAVQVSEEVLDKKGKLRVDYADVLSYAHGEYHKLGSRIGVFGFSVRKR